MRSVARQVCAVVVMAGSLLATSTAWSQTPPGDGVYVMNADGTGWQKFFQLPQVSKLGSPAISADGRYLAFDGWMQGEGSGDSRLFVISTDRDEFWMLGSGCMPSWGADNRRLACSFYDGVGVGILTIATLQVQTIDEQGWGAQWSPDGRWVFYYKGTQLWLYDVDAESRRMVFDASPHFSRLWWNAGWSPDSRRVVFAGSSNDSRRDIASIDVIGDQRDFKWHVKGKTPVQKYSWHRSQPRVLFPMSTPETGRMQIWEFDPTQPENTIKLLQGQDSQTPVEAAVWSPDGEKIYFTGRLK